MSEKVSRRDFLKLAGAGLGALAFTRPENALATNYSVFSGINEGNTVLAVVNDLTGQVSMGIGDPEYTTGDNGEPATLMRGWVDIVQGNGAILVETEKPSLWRKSPGNEYQVHDRHFQIPVAVQPEISAKGLTYGSPEYNQAIFGKTTSVSTANVTITETSYGEKKSILVDFGPDKPKFGLRPLKPVQTAQPIQQTSDLLARRDDSQKIMKLANYIVTPAPTEIKTEAPVEEIHMTFEDWKKFLDIPYRGFRIDNTNAVFEKKFSDTVLTGKEGAVLLSQLDKTIPFVVLGTDGIIQVHVTKNYAQTALENGATVLVSHDTKSSSAITHILMDAANIAYERGDVKSNGDSKVTFNFNTQSDLKDMKAHKYSMTFKLHSQMGDYEILIVKDENGRSFTPVIPSMPSLTSLMGTPGNGLASTTIDIAPSDDKYWIEKVLEAGDYKYLVIAPY